MDWLIRYAETEDALSVARVHVRSWQTAYRGLLPEEYLARLRPEDRAERYDLGNRDPKKPQTIVAIDQETVRGFATVSSAREEDLAGFGELCALYADPDYWNCGIGRALIRTARELMSGCSFRGALLWLLEGNLGAARFYERDNWKADGTRREESVWGLRVQELRYVRPLDIFGPGTSDKRDPNELSVSGLVPRRIKRPLK